MQQGKKKGSNQTIRNDCRSISWQKVNLLPHSTHFWSFCVSFTKLEKCRPVSAVKAQLFYLYAKKIKNKSQILKGARWSDIEITSWILRASERKGSQKSSKHEGVTLRRVYWENSICGAGAPSGDHSGPMRQNCLDISEYFRMPSQSTTICRSFWKFF